MSVYALPRLAVMPGVVRACAELDAADVVLGQPDASSREKNRGAAVASDSFRWPHGFAGPAMAA